MVTICHFSRLIQTQAKKYGARRALSYRDYAAGKWRDVSWTAFAGKVGTVSDALLALGVKVQENIAVFSQNMPEDLYVDFGAYGIRAVTIPFYPTSSVAQVQYMTGDAGVRFLFVGGQLQYDIAFQVFSLSETLERMIIFDPAVVRHPSDKVSIYFDEFLKMGRDGANKDEVARRTALAKPEDTANILYTSGTTGASKGVIISHEMYLNAMRENDAVLPMSEEDVLLNFLPFTHVFERGWAYLGLCEGCTLAINLKPGDVLQSLREVHPTCMSAVPRFWEKVYEAALELMNHAPSVQQKLFRRAMKTGRTYVLNYESKGLKPPMRLKMEYGLMKKTLFSLLKRNLGLERANFFPTAGAAIAREVETFVHICDIQMVTGYGLTESTATVSCDHIGRPFTIGSVGRVLGGVEIKISEQGEILLRGKTITKGYYHKPKATHEAIDDEGWFHTGDAGYLKNGELFLTDRIKDLYKTSNGKYIAPALIESKLVVDKYIDQIVVIADRRKFVSALIVPVYKLLEQYARGHGIAFENRKELCSNQQIHDFLAERIDTLQQGFAHYEQVKRFALLPEPLSMERGELTNTLKVKRKVVLEHYQKEIDAMYED